MSHIKESAPVPVKASSTSKLSIPHGGGGSKFNSAENSSACINETLKTAVSEMLQELLSIAM